MKRFLAPLALALITGTTAHAQSITRSYSTSDGWGGYNSSTSTTSLTGQIANQTINGGFPSYAGGVPSYNTSNSPAPTYNYFYAPTYNSSNYNYGYGYGYGAQASAPYGYYNPGSYWVPGQTIVVGQPSVTFLPQVVTNNLDCTPYSYGYGYTAGGNIGYTTTTILGGVNNRDNGVNVGIGGGSVQNRRNRPSQSNRRPSRRNR